MDELRETLDAGYPPIIILGEGEAWSHAVVVCDINEEGVILMDPLFGEYQYVTHAALSESWYEGHGEVIQVGKSRRE